VLAAKYDPNAFDAVEDELDYAYTVKSEKEKKRAARAKTKGIKAINIFIAQALVNKTPRDTSVFLPVGSGLQLFTGATGQIPSR
jgi:hypothetical protein